MCHITSTLNYHIVAIKTNLNFLPRRVLGRVVLSGKRHRRERVIGHSNEWIILVFMGSGLRRGSSSPAPVGRHMTPIAVLPSAWQLGHCIYNVTVVDACVSSTIRVIVFTRAVVDFTVSVVGVTGGLSGSAADTRQGSFAGSRKCAPKNAPLFSHYIGA